MNINEKTINILNVTQNSLIWYMLKMHKSSHMSNILKALKILKIKQLICKNKINFVKQLVNHSLCKQILDKIIDNRNLNEKSNSFVEDLKLISNILKCNIQEVGKNKHKIMQLERLEEIYSKSNEDFEMIKFCLDGIIF